MTVQGVNVAGYLTAESGVGEAGRQYLEAVKATGDAVAAIDWAATSSRRGHPLVVAPSDPVHDINLVVVNADQMPHFRREMGEGMFADRYTIGVWAWEVDVFPPAFHGAFELVDEVWMGSEFARAAVAAVAPPGMAVLAIPPPVSTPSVAPVSRTALGLEPGFHFLYLFDYMSVFERKNPIGVVEAFSRAFRAGDGPRLVVKSINGHRFPAHARALSAAASGRPDIDIRDGFMNAGEKNALLAACDSYVSLHRSEGFGLTVAEAMALGKPVIATAFSGTADLLDATNGFPVPYALVPVVPGCEPYPVTARWADPDVDAAAHLMREVVDDPGGARVRGDRARADIAARHSASARGAVVADRLSAVRRYRHARAAVARVKDSHRGWTVPNDPSRYGALGVLARRALFRMLRPYWWGERTFDQNVVDALAVIAEQGGDGFSALPGDATTSREVRSISAQVDDLRHQLHALPYSNAAVPLRTTDMWGRQAIGLRRHDLADGNVYLGFEEVFRGPVPFIRDRLRVYLEIVASREPVLDVGCGRGEMLDLLSGAGVPATGIDLNEEAVARCRARGHRAEVADANDYIASCAEGSLGTVFSAQVIEHLGYDAILNLFEQSLRALAPGGVFIAETVNPHSPPALKTFWVDLTHQHPVFPEAIAVVAVLSGFDDAWILFPHGTGELSRDIVEQGEYALVATKAAAPS